MSDEEMPPMGGPDDFEDDDMDYDDLPPKEELPEGIKKEIITEASSSNWKKPKKGDEVTVHYVGTLESDGSEFDSSRARNDPFVFTLGKGQVIKGWDLGVATMKKGELAKFTLAPEFAYGDAGSPPKIPEKATLVFEVELISWASKDDLFGDEGVIKTQLKEGSGWKQPKNNDEVVLSVKTVGQDGSVIEERNNFEYVVGSTALGKIGQACDKALQGMKRGEQADLKCSEAYAYGEEKKGGATITLTLEEIYETKDVSPLKDKSLMKKTIKEGEGYDMAKECSKVKLSVEAATDGTSALPGFTAKVLEFTVGNGEVCDALEFAITEMKKGERAILTAKTELALEAQVGLGDAKSASKVVYTLELQEFEKAKDHWSLDEEEKLEFAMSRKEVGGTLFKKGRLQLALQRYKGVNSTFLNYVDNFKEENKVKAKELKKVCELNTAACQLKLLNYTEARAACDTVLKDDKENVKALYRRAQAEYGLKNFQEAIRDCKKAATADPQNKDARELLKKAQAGQKEVDKQSKGMFANMCKALGKGPIPEPYKAKPPGAMGSDDEDDFDDGAMDDDAAKEESKDVEMKDAAPAGEGAAS